ncbi:unnamed protein product [Staurois parvus]|uniref:Uncharacterized protein n=1 Tax=Staurois parvus TaxID=386267 RepID=A0ABN9AMM3_9NEOB|nr:unnamed protein product [Staurois parvus]
MSLFHIFKFPAVPSPYVLTSQGTEPRRRMPASAGGHCQGHCRRDIMGAKDKVSEEEISEQCCRVLPSVARVTACATLGNTSREVK